MSASEADAVGVIERLGLHPHAEGGHFRETFRHRPECGGRGAMTAILYLLAAGEFSGWHRVDATEVWHFHAGAPLELAISEDGRALRTHRLGADLLAGEEPQVTVPPTRGSSRARPGHGLLPGARLGRRSSSPASSWRRGAGSPAPSESLDEHAGPHRLRRRAPAR